VLLLVFHLIFLFSTATHPLLAYLISTTVTTYSLGSRWNSQNQYQHLQRYINLQRYRNELKRPVKIFGILLVLGFCSFWKSHKPATMTFLVSYAVLPCDNTGSFLVPPSLEAQVIGLNWWFDNTIHTEDLERDSSRQRLLSVEVQNLHADSGIPF
jgi:hypothetical protein